MSYNSENVNIGIAVDQPPVASALADTTARTLSDCHLALGRIEAAIHGPTPVAEGAPKAPGGLLASMLDNQSAADGVLSRLRVIERALTGQSDGPSATIAKRAY